MDYFIKFGYTKKTGIDLPGEAIGIYHNIDNFNSVELAVYSFGQTFKITPIRQLASISVVANGGNEVVPFVVKRIIDNEGNILYEKNNSLGNKIISTEVCNTISDILEKGVSGDGGAKNAAIEGYKIAAKTGTSQIRDIKNENLYVGSCVAYAPSNDPTIATIIVVDQPKSYIYYGSAVAAPYVKELLSGILPYLGYEPEYLENEKERINIRISDYEKNKVSDAIKEISKLGLEYEIVGKGEFVIKQVPLKESEINKKYGKVILYTEDYEKEEVKVPNVEGLNATLAINTLVNLGLNYKIVGVLDYEKGIGAKVISQSIKNIDVEKYTIVEITLRYIESDE